MRSFFIRNVMGEERKNIVRMRTSSAQNPVAHCAILCSSQEQSNPLVLKALSLSGSQSSLPRPLKVILSLQLFFGLRISEVLRLASSDLLALNRIRIRSSKRGKDRIISYSDPTGYLQKCRLNSLAPFFDYNRFNVYRLYKQNGLMLYLGINKKYSVTHLFRHLLATSLINEIDDKHLISDLLGHKSPKSIESYI